MTYEGGLVDAIREGYGRFNFPVYYTYEGGYLHGKRHGKGTLILGDVTSPDLTIEGTFVEGELTGIGTKVWRDGKTYTGMFLNGEPNGEGELTIPGRGVVYNGCWKDGKRHGKGTSTSLTTVSNTTGTTITRVYEGDFYLNKPHGQGRYEDTLQYTPTKEDSITESIPTGLIIAYEGTFVDGVPSGEGVAEFQDGSIYEGEMLQGKRHGRGTQRMHMSQYNHQIWKGDEKNTSSSSPSSSSSTTTTTATTVTSASPSITTHISYSGEWENDIPTQLGTSLQVQVSPWLLPTITTWPLLPNSTSSSSLSSPSSSASSSSSSSSTKPGAQTAAAARGAGASTTAKPGTQTAAPATVISPFPLHRPEAVLAMPGGALPTLTLGVLHSPYTTTKQEEATNVSESLVTTTTKGRGSSGYYDGTSASAFSQPGAATTTATVATISSSSSRYSGIGIWSASSSSPSSSSSFSSSSYVLTESGRTFEIQLVPHETSNTAFSAAAIAAMNAPPVTTEKPTSPKAKSAGLAAAQRAVQANSVVRLLGGGGGGASSSPTKLAAPPKSLVPPPEAIPVPIRIHQDDAAATMQNASDPITAVATSTIITGVIIDTEQERGAVSSANTVDGKPTDIHIITPRPLVNMDILSQPASTDTDAVVSSGLRKEVSAAYFTTTTTASPPHNKSSLSTSGNDINDSSGGRIVIESSNSSATTTTTTTNPALSLPSETPPGQYTLVIRDISRIFYVPVPVEKIRLPSVYIPLDVLPPAAFAVPSSSSASSSTSSPSLSSAPVSAPITSPSGAKKK